MADKKDTSWWDSWISTAKEKSWSAYEMAKKDVSEFVTTLQTDTTQIVAETADTLKTKLTMERNDETTGQTDLTLEQPTSSIDDIIHVKYESKAVNRLEAKMEALRDSPMTYREEPTDEVFQQWQVVFNAENFKSEISELLVDKPGVRGLYSKLVPSEMSHHVFWQRYFYKVHLLKLEDERRTKLLARTTEVEDEVDWGDEDESDGYNDSASNRDDNVEAVTVETEIAANVNKVAEAQDVYDKSDQDNDCKVIKTDDTSENICLQEDKEDDTKSSCKTEGGIEADETSPEMIVSIIENSNDSEDTSVTVSHEEKITTSDDVEARKELCNPDVGVRKKLCNPDVDNVTEDPGECREITEPSHIEEKDCNPPQQTKIELPAISQTQSLSFNADEDSSGIVRISDEDLKDVNGKSSGDSKKGGSEDSASDDWETEFDLELENVEAIDSVEVTEGVDNGDWDSWDES